MMSTAWTSEPCVPVQAGMLDRLARRGLMCADYQTCAAVKSRLRMQPNPSVLGNRRICMPV